MPTAPDPQPTIQAPIGVHGSLIRVLKEDSQTSIWGTAPVPQNVNFDERPAQQSEYPTIVIRSDGTDLPEIAFEQNKLKRYNVTIEVYGLNLAQAELLGEAVERSLERGDGPEDDAHCAARRIASLTADDPDCISIYDRGGEKYETESHWSPASERTVRGTLRYTIEIVRRFS